jgi:hypothetical protein
MIREVVRELANGLRFLSEVLRQALKSISLLIQVRADRNGIMHRPERPDLKKPQRKSFQVYARCHVRHYALAVDTRRTLSIKLHVYFL